MYSGTEGTGTPAPSSTPTRGGTPGHYGRGRGGPVQPTTSRGARGGSYSGRGRGRCLSAEYTPVTNMIMFTSLACSSGFSATTKCPYGPKK